MAKAKKEAAAVLPAVAKAVAANDAQLHLAEIVERYETIRKQRVEIVRLRTEREQARQRLAELKAAVASAAEELLLLIEGPRLPLVDAPTDKPG